MPNKGKRAWMIDKEGIVHWPGPKRGQTFCRRPSRLMEKSFDGTLFLTCEACRDLYYAKRLYEGKVSLEKPI